MTYIAAKSDVHISSLPQICLRFLIPPQIEHSGMTVLFCCTVTCLARAQKGAQDTR